MDEMAKLISQYGFPMVVALYTLIRLETTMKEHTKILTMLYEKIGGKQDV